MRVLSHHRLNIHSASAQGGLIHFDKGQVKNLPNEDTQHPGYKLLVSSGYIVELKDLEPEVKVEWPIEPEPEEELELVLSVPKVKGRK